MNKKTKTILLTVGIVLLGFLREYLFVNINWIYLTLTNGRMNGARREFHFLIDWAPSEILLLKWLLTLLFSISFFLVTSLIIKVFFQNKQYNKIVAFVYIALIAISGALYLAGKFLGIYLEIYGAIRTLMGMVQSFMPLMILVVLFKFLPQVKRD